MDRRLAEQITQVEHYLERVREHIDLGAMDEAEGWCVAMLEEAATLHRLLVRRAHKATK